jgi:EAL domain-containing protein (putative c-di-GMP-specific phosphodiesterase class I)
LLRGCRESDAVVVADQYLALLRDVVLEIDGRQLPLDLRYRIVSMDQTRVRSRHKVSRLYVSPPIAIDSKLAKQLDVAGNRVDLSTSKVVSLNVERANRHNVVSSDKADKNEHNSCNPVFEVSKPDTAKAWRLRPGMLITRMPLLCCYQLQPVYRTKQTEYLQETNIVASMLNALALHVSETRPLVESQLILSVQAEQVVAGFAQWISGRCNKLRVAPSDVCFSISVDSLATDLRRIAPELRILNRYGIRLMLEGVNSSNQFRMMKNIAHFDYLQISGRALNDSLNQLAARVNLESIIAEARNQHCEICTGGVDNDLLMKHALSMQIDIGFGRSCGTSVAFPSQAWTPGTQATDRAR